MRCSWRTIERNILLPIEFAGKPTDAYRASMAQLLKLTGLSEFGDRYPRELSGGMRQRAAIGNAACSRCSRKPGYDEDQDRVELITD